MPCPATYQQEARAIVRTAAPIASAAALTAQPLAACPLRVASALQVGNDCSTFCAASPPSLSLRGGRRPTWQSRSIRLNRGKAIGEIATAFPRLHPKGTSSRFALRAPRPRWGLAMTNLEAFAVLTIACTNRKRYAGSGCPLPYRVHALNRSIRRSSAVTRRQFPWAAARSAPSPFCRPRPNRSTPCPKSPRHCFGPVYLRP